MSINQSTGLIQTLPLKKKNTAIFLFQSNPAFLCWIHAYVVSSNVGQSSVFSWVYDLDMFEEYWLFCRRLLNLGLSHVFSWLVSG